MKHLFSLAIIMIIGMQLSAQGPAFIKIQAHLSEPLPSKQALYIRGDHGMMGKWKYGQVRLAKKADTLWSGIFLVNKGDEINFVLDGGRPSKIFEGLDTVSIKVEKDSAYDVMITTPLKETRPSIPQGKIHNLPGTVPEGLQDRKVFVRTPSGYYSDTSRSYPVIYMMDAQSLFSDKDSPDGFAWKLDKTLDSLEAKGAIEPVILVAVEHVFDARSLEYSDTDLGERYRNYLSQNLVRSIDLQFRTKSDAANRILGGSIAGGFVSLLTAWENPDVFQNVIALSPAVRIYENNFFQILEGYEGPAKPLNIYLDYGEFGLDEKIAPGVKELQSYLDTEGYQHTIKYHPNSIPDGENMAYRIIPALKYFFETNPE